LSSSNYINGWYRKYKSGWLEQGFRKNTNTDAVFVFPIPMMDTNYAVQIGGTLDGMNNTVSTYYSSLTTTSLKAGARYGGSSVAGEKFYIEIKGMAA
jgi:hypothetical protein